MYDTMQIHDIVFIKLKFTSNARYLKMDYKLKMYFQRAVIKTVAIIGVPHSYVPRPWWQLAQAQAPTWNHSEPVGYHATASVLGYHKPYPRCHLLHLLHKW